MSAQQVYFLTGAASGIGQHLADKLIVRGHNVFATDINFDALCAHAQANHWPEDRVRLRRLDVLDAGIGSGRWKRPSRHLSGLMWR